MASSSGKTKRNHNLLRLVEERALSKKIEKEQKKQEVPYLSKDCVWNILIRLPIQSLSSMRFVCKPWCSIISDGNFIDAHLRCSETVLISLRSFVLHPSKTTPPDPPNTFSVEASLLQRKPLSIFDHPFKNGPSKLYIQFMEIKEGKGKIEEYNISCFGIVRASCNGLILVDNQLKRGGLIVMNPVTRKLIALPVGTINPRNESFGFALSEVTGEYKVVHLFQDKLGYISCETINLGTRVWREVNGPSFGLFQTFEHKPVSAIGALHWLPEIRINDYIVSMEVDNETFHTLSLPKTGGCYDRIIEKDGFLCFVTHEELNIDIWILKGLSREVWTKHYSLTNGSVIDMVPLLSFKVSGDIVFMRKEDGSYYVYNFKLQMMTKVEMEEGHCWSSSSFMLPHVNSLVSWERN
ncbi:hypothetical protein LWI28_001949 [Acer negundo]|uniref:F-box domain-containing protein n=1 Tax=Acer negundo TaxID=4023 RepID=A0AAD5P6G0_ACENE|nr:hypothetical protein LWI28_001949 [Acer negundo]KAK4859268.1 hypothetical protein QYF36_002476 [Acer negundo]